MLKCCLASIGFFRAVNTSSLRSIPAGPHPHHSIIRIDKHSARLSLRKYLGLPSSDTARLRVTTLLIKGREVFTNFFSNRKPQKVESRLPFGKTQLSAQATTSEVSDAKLGKNSENGKPEAGMSDKISDEMPDKPKMHPLSRSSPLLFSSIPPTSSPLTSTTGTPAASSNLSAVT